MSQKFHSLRAFLRKEDGAITVDWVVLTAAFAGASIAAVAMISDGWETLASRLDGELGTSSLQGRPVSQVMAAMTFSTSDEEDWSEGSVLSPLENYEGGTMLVIGPRQTSTFDMNLPYDRNEATITFSLIGGDSLDNEKATITINGQEVLIAQSIWGGKMGFTDKGLDGFKIETEVLIEGENLGGSSNTGWKESVTSITITIENPEDKIVFGISSNANQHIGDEFFGIDNFIAIAK